jgi:hypothetical protein
MGEVVGLGGCCLAGLLFSRPSAATPFPIATLAIVKPRFQTALAKIVHFIVFSIRSKPVKLRLPWW